MGPRLWQTSGSVWKQSCLAVPVYPWLPEKLGQSWRGGHTMGDFGLLEAQFHPAPPCHARTLIFTSFGASFFTSLNSLSPKPEWAGKENLK